MKVVRLRRVNLCRLVIMHHCKEGFNSTGKKDDEATGSNSSTNWICTYAQGMDIAKGLVVYGKVLNPARILGIAINSNGSHLNREDLQIDSIFCEAQSQVATC